MKERESRENKYLREAAEAKVFMNHYLVTCRREHSLKRAILSLDDLCDVYSLSEDIDPNYDPKISIELWGYGYDLRKLLKHLFPLENE